MLVLKDWTYSIISEVQTQNDYICKWLPKKEDFLQILLDLEAPPLPYICKTCRKDGVYRCPDCMHQPLLCTDCCCSMHAAHPFHRIQQWTGDFFKDSALHMTGLLLHLGHDGAPCPSASANAQATTSKHMQPVGMDEGEWEDIDYIPLHLRPPVGSKYLTVINVTGVHFMLAQACQCVNAESYHMQLFHAKLYPSTFERPSTAFIFLVLDDFLRDNVECGTSGMNYYSKLRQVTSSVFPHLVADQYWELLRVAQQWCLLKLLKWSGFQDNKNGSTKGDLALFCAACPQPGINLSLQANLDHWRYTRTVVMDGNFKAEHMHEHGCYCLCMAWLFLPAFCCGLSKRRKVRSTIASYTHSRMFRQLNMDYSLCNALSYNMNSIQNVICFYDINCTYMKNLQKWVDKTMLLEISPLLRIMAGIGMWHVHRHKKECYARYSPLFIKGSGWVNSEIIEILWSTLNIVSASTHTMTLPHRQELLDFQMNDSNFMKMIWMISSLSWKVKAAWEAVSLARESFERLNQAVPSSQKRRLL
ncbi:hypothetical protein F5141DRAFT_996728 [Pisolithus sp. B1]|nr:hypothetical protein F5141DRAFT_996728 [Pisolithus sp. B1]